MPLYYFAHMGIEFAFRFLCFQRQVACCHAHEYPVPSGSVFLRIPAI